MGGRAPVLMLVAANAVVDAVPLVPVAPTRDCKGGGQQQQRWWQRACRGQPEQREGEGARRHADARPGAWLPCPACRPSLGLSGPPDSQPSAHGSLPGPRHVTCPSPAAGSTGRGAGVAAGGAAFDRRRAGRRAPRLRPERPTHRPRASGAPAACVRTLGLARSVLARRLCLVAELQATVHATDPAVKRSALRAAFVAGDARCAPGVAQVVR